MAKISAYIKKIKGTNNLYKSFNEFDLEWLSSFDEELTDNVKRMFESVSYEMIFGDGYYNKKVLDDFIISLEDLLKVKNYSNINDYIKKYKGSIDIYKPYIEFDLEWLSLFDNKLTDNVRIEFDLISNERIYGNRYDIVLDDFIISLEKLIKN